MKLIFKNVIVLAAIWQLSIFNCNAQNKITGYQYWIDNQYTNGNYEPVLSAELLELKSAVSLENLETGLHTFNISFKDEKGIWSVPLSQFFYYIDLKLTENKITDYQYWFDNNYSTNKLVSLPPSEIIHLNTQLTFENIKEGLHIFSLRFKDSSGKWSIPVNQYFYKSKNISVLKNNIIVYRYWLNDDLINAKYVSISNPSQILNMNEDLKLTGLSTGEYTIHFQFKDSSNKWSLVTSDKFWFDNTSSQKIVFSTGWNMFSLNVVPDNPDLQTVFQLPIDNKSLVKIQDELGNSMEDWEFFGGWTNNIGDVLASEGYRIKFKTKDSLEVNGEPVTYPFPIALKAGWNIMGYPQRNAFDGMNSIVQQLIDRGSLVKIQDELGNSIEDWDFFGGWTNNIGDFLPGEGYRIKVNTDDTLWIYESYEKSSVIKSEKVVTTHFKRAFEGNGIDHMNINIVDLPVNFIHAGDEIAVFDGSTCVGTIKVLAENLENQTATITASAKDNYGMKGFSEGKSYLLKLWSAANNQEYILNPEVLKGPSIFVKYESAFISLEKFAITGLDENQDRFSQEIICYPNPFKNEITIEFFLKDDNKISSEVMNQLGQKVATVASKRTMKYGRQLFKWNGTDSSGHVVPSGIYFIKIMIGDESYFKKVIFNKTN